MLYLAFIFLAGAVSVYVSGALNFICWLGVFFILCLVDAHLWPNANFGLSTLWGFMGIAYLTIRFIRSAMGRY